MSEIERERSEDIVRNNDGDGSDRRDDHRKKKQREHGFGGNFRKAKRVALFQFRKAEKQLHRKNKKGSNQSSSIPGCLGNRISRNAVRVNLSYQRWCTLQLQMGFKCHELTMLVPNL
ncbi:hypothetical protein ACSBR1_004011 [Camellia fascicularis]